MTKILSELIFARPKNNAREHQIPHFAESAILSVTEPPGDLPNHPLPYNLYEFFSGNFRDQNMGQNWCGRRMQKKSYTFSRKLQGSGLSSFFSEICVHTYFYEITPTRLKSHVPEKTTELTKLRISASGLCVSPGPRKHQNYFVPKNDIEWTGEKHFFAKMHKKCDRRPKSEWSRTK